jgi:hypothetical protein
VKSTVLSSWRLERSQTERVPRPETTVVAAGMVGIAGRIGNLDDLADAVEDAVERDQAADDRAAGRDVRPQMPCAEPSRLV